jgi:hypothetical protein
VPRNACNSLEHTARSPTPMACSENGALELCVGQGYVKMTRGFIRGGNWNNGTNAGAFALNLNNAPTDTNTNIGFRVARSLRLCVWYARCKAQECLVLLRQRAVCIERSPAYPCPGSILSRIRTGGAWAFCCLRAAGQATMPGIVLKGGCFG